MISTYISEQGFSQKNIWWAFLACDALQKKQNIDIDPWHFPT